jgi:hypothetical protein
VVQVNENYLKLKAGYLFPEIAKRVKIFSQSNNRRCYRTITQSMHRSYG